MHALPLALLAAGCASLGPRTIPRDRFDHAQALRQSWKEEMLLDIVGLRYVELPVSPLRTRPRATMSLARARSSAG